MTDMNQRKNKLVSAAHLAVVTLGLIATGIAVTGCGTGLSTSAATGTVPVTAAAPKGLHGNVHGGQQPVSGAAIQLYAVGSSGLGSAATPLIAVGKQVVYNSGAAAGTTGALTDASGNFNITADYTCPTPSPQVYIVSVGGNSGSGTNSGITMMAALGDCATLVSKAASTFVLIDEVTTVAAAYALSPFMTSYTNVGAATVNSPGLINAVGSFNVLANIGNGLVGGPAAPTGVVLPTTEIYTLADILASCVNSSSNTSTPCAAIFGATGATETIGAALYIAKNPSSPAVLALTQYASAVSPFQPTYSATPNDYTLAIKYNAGGNLSAPYGIAIDANGNAWVTNSTGSSVTELGPTGTPGTVLTGGGLLGPKGISIDRSSNVWIANPAANSVVEFNTAGTLESGAGFTAGGLNGPVAIANDSAGNAWVANLTGNSVTELSTTGTALKTSLTAGATISLPTGIALDSNGNVYVANNGTGNVIKLSNSTGAQVGSALSDVALQGASAVALDSSNDVWATGSITGTAVTGATSQFNSAGVTAPVSPVSGGGLALPGGVATAGTTAFVTNGAAAGSLSKLNYNSATTVSPTTGFGAANATLGLTGLNAPVGVAIDGSGNVWTANSGDNTVSVFLGLSTPVVTPLAANVGP